MYSAVTATDLSQWADRREAQSQLPVLVRRLIHCSDLPLTAISFPGGDSVQLGGLDGALEAETGNIWVPAGRSVWEMGCDRKVKQKADEDYRKRTNAIQEGDRRRSTFVFVTPRRWPGKVTWVAARKAEEQWADIRCLDADDLEQWIEISPTAAAWVARAMGKAVDGLLSGSDFWRIWSGAAKPSIPSGLLLTGRDGLVSRLIGLIEGRPSQAITVAADSRQEAIAFVCAALGTQSRFSDRLLVADSHAELDNLGKLGTNILALSNAALEERFAYLASQIPLIVPLARGQAGREPDIDLEPLSGEQFEACLEDLGLSAHEVTLAARESGRSVTILRRRWAVTPALAQPKWSGDSDIARKLVPFGLCGAWNLDRDGDIRTLAAIANLPNEQIEQDGAELLALDDAPIEAIGRYNRVVSQIDALFAIGRRISKSDLDRFFSVVERAISVRDPALDLPEEERWMANVLGKEHPFSGALLKGVGNTLVLFSIHGNAICGQRLGVDIQGRTSALVSRLLTDLTGEQWLSIRGNLRLLAEASPNAFLGAIERELASADPTIMALMPVTKGGAGGNCQRTELLWALELLGWAPQTYGRVVDILARLSRVPLDDNWMNKPANSLHSLFRAWLPKTAAPVETRIATLKRLFDAEPVVAFAQAASLVDSRYASATDNARPRWRGDAANSGRGASQEEYRDMVLAASDLLLSRGSYSLAQLKQLLPIVACLTSEDQTRFWRIVEEWTAASPDDDKAELRETLRQYVTRRSKKKQHVADAELAFRRLEPSDLCQRHKWLFDKHWIEFSADELEDGLDHNDRQKRTDEARVLALRQIHAERGIEGVFDFAVTVKQPGLVAYYMARRLHDLFSRERVMEVMQRSLPSDALRHFRIGYFSAIEPVALRQVLQEFSTEFSKGEISIGEFVGVLCDAPTGREVWGVVDQSVDEVKTEYWSKVNVGWFDWAEEDVVVIINNLLRVNRPRSAFFAIRLDKKLVSAQSMYDVLYAVMTVDEEGASFPDIHDIGDAFKILDQDPGFDRAAVARLEFGYCKALVQTGRGLRDLGRQLIGDPAQYVQMLSYIYRRDDDGEDPEGWQIADEQQARNVGELCREIVDYWNVVKGFTNDDSLDAVAFKTWISKCRTAATEVARSTIVDLKIGNMLAWKAHRGEAVWPCPEVCDILEIGADSMRDGFHTGVFNARGMTSRGAYEGGQQERNLAQRFDDYAAALEVRWPKVAATIRGLADGYRRDGDWNDRRARLNQIYDL
ncbi:hypothetical protein [Ferrovibrio sp.]|uniref:hypothetical protein n=1 Tax=Ferrovibrio sp. TaxID=1917215 RepID=UPI00311FFEBB